MKKKFNSDQFRKDLCSLAQKYEFPFVYGGLLHTQQNERYNFIGGVAGPKKVSLHILIDLFESAGRLNQFIRENFKKALKLQ